MNLERLRHHWDAWGREDPFWAILTHPDKRGNRWDEASFFAGGAAEIDVIMGELRRLVPSIRTRTALDFGCGAGRLTQGLAVHFESVVGVDIARSMVDLAQQWNRHPDRCRYVVNTAGDLRAFEDGSVDLVLSLITLQHMAPRYAVAYIAEFVRVTAPGGLVYFQLPTGLVPPPPDAGLVRRMKARLRARAPDALVRGYDDLKWRLSGEGPRMEAHSVPEADVVRTLEAAGAAVLRTWDDGSAGPSWMSRRYCAIKTPAAS